MHTFRLILYSSVILSALGGCAASTVNTARERGAEKLNVDEIYSLVNSNTLHLVSSDFDAMLFLSDTGKLAAKSITDTNDSGKWDIREDSALCIKFQIWYYGDTNCYTVYRQPEKDRYLLFSANGALAYSADITSGNTSNLEIKSKKNKYVRSELNKTNLTDTSTPTDDFSTKNISDTGGSFEDPAQTVKDIARDCPGCNLEKADLRQANLVAANLKGANLKGADLSRANLRRANLEGANLSGATLLSTNLPGANLKGADLTGADLSGANIIQADLTGAKLDNTIINNTLTEGARGI